MWGQENFSCRPVPMLTKMAPAAINPFVFPYSADACIDNYYKSAPKMYSQTTPDHVAPE